MSKPTRSLSLFDRFRRASALRVVFLVAALFASQSSLACAFEEVFAAPQAEAAIAAADSVSGHAPDFEKNSGDDCCGLCRNCTHCGGCCSFAVAVRAGDASVSGLFTFHANLSFATAARPLWTPPTLLKPPIDES